MKKIFENEKEFGGKIGNATSFTVKKHNFLVKLIQFGTLSFPLVDLTWENAKKQLREL